jgi:hypothetical protein
VRRVVAILAACSACGDAIERPPEIESVSGTRVKLELYLYDDGTRQVDPRAFYDTHQHTRCEPRRWVDGVQRCVPIADEAAYTDAACSELVGIAPALPPRPPTHFLGIDWVDSAPVPARLYRAGAPTGAIGSYFMKRDGACVGPQAAPSEAAFYEVGDELPASAMAVLDDSELGTGRVALRMLGSSDGMQVAIGVRDRAHDLPCTPRARGDGVACEPVDAVPATRFLDSSCTIPAVTVASSSPVPAVASRIDSDDGCASYFSVGAEVSPPLYRRDAGGCVHVSSVPGQRAFALAPIELAPLDATVDDTSGRRLAAVKLADPADLALRFTGELLIDRAIRGECRPEQVGEDVRCQPMATVPATTLYTTGCAAAVSVVEVGESACRPIGFATAAGIEGSVLHAVGAPAADPLFQILATGCTPYTPEPGRVVRMLGPPLPAETFVRAIKYGER